MLLEVALAEKVVITDITVRNIVPQVLVQVVQHVALALWSSVTTRDRTAHLDIRPHHRPPKTSLDLGV